MDLKRNGVNRASLRRIALSGAFTALTIGVGGSITYAAGRQGLALSGRVQMGLNAYGGLGAGIGSFANYDRRR